LSVEIQKPQRKKNVNAINYIDNKRFLEEIKKHKIKVQSAKEAGKPIPAINNYLGDCIMKIGKKVSTIPKFNGYSFKEEMISDGIENAIMYFDRFDADKYDNPFAYYTQIMVWAFVRRINKEEKNRYTLYKNFEVNMVLNGQADFDDTLTVLPMYDNMLVFIARYEFKEIKKKFRRLTLQGKTEYSDVESLCAEIMQIKGVPVPTMIAEIVSEISITQKQLDWFHDIMGKYGYMDIYKPKELLTC